MKSSVGNRTTSRRTTTNENSTTGGSNEQGALSTNRKLKGLLAFLGDRLIQYQSTVPEIIETEKLLADAALVLFFVYHPHQPFSTRLRKQLQALLKEFPDIIAIGIDSTGTRENISDVFFEEKTEEKPKVPPRSSSSCHFLSNTGFCSLFDSDRVMYTVLGITQVPMLIVLNGQGRKLSSLHEEYTLEWNSYKTTVERWKNNRSALDCNQQVLVHMIHPACNIL